MSLPFWGPFYQPARISHLVFALQFLLQSFNLLLIPIRNSGAGLFAFKSGCSVLAKLSLPLVKDRRVDVMFVAQIINGFTFNQMLAESRPSAQG